MGRSQEEKEQHMAVYEVEMDPAAQDPGEWSGCDILRSIRSIGNDYYLVDMDPEVADTVRGLPGIRKFEPASDGQHVANNGRIFQVRGGEMVVD
jgi:hypothetical protein